MLRTILIGLALMAASWPAWSQRVEVQGVGGRIVLDLREGFYDASGAPMVRNGRPIGAERIQVMRDAAQFWADRLVLVEPVVIAVRFADLLCGPSGAVLGSAGPAQFYSDFAGAPRQGVWYPIALANQFAGRDLMVNAPDINARFNANLDYGCLEGLAWYYGRHAMASPPGTFALYNTAVHEFGHGFGFTTMLNVETGSVANGYVDHYLGLVKAQNGTSLAQLSTDQRRHAVTSDALTWHGGQAMQQAVSETGLAEIRMHAPAELRRGSTLSHFSARLNSANNAPDETMTPSYIQNSSLWLSVAALGDMGWPLVQRTDDLILVPSQTLVDPGQRAQLRLFLKPQVMLANGHEQVFVRIEGANLMELIGDQGQCQRSVSGFDCSLASFVASNTDDLVISFNVLKASEGDIVVRAGLASAYASEQGNAELPAARLVARIQVRQTLAKDVTTGALGLNWLIFCAMVSILGRRYLRHRCNRHKKHLGFHD